MASRKSKGISNWKAELAKRQKQRLEKRGGQSQVLDRDIPALKIRPKVTATESNEDAAVFNKDCLLKLSNELQLEAKKVIESLELTAQGKFDESLECLKDIARSSPFADWRLFVRGLQAFYRGDVDSTRQNWSRLDRSRRAARIATTLLTAEFDQPLAHDFVPCSSTFVEHAKTLRFRKEAVTAAEAIAKTKHRDPEITFAISQVAMLADFFDRFRHLDAEFVATVGQACVGLAQYQDDFVVFDRLTIIVPGTASDPKWNLARFLYLLQFEGGENDALQASHTYFKQDLPKLTHLPEQVRNAIGCKLHLIWAEALRSSNRMDENPFAFRLLKIDYPKIDAFLRKAIEIYPADPIPYERLIDSLRAQMDQRGISKLEEEKLEKQLVNVKEQLVRAIPEDVETSLWLIDHYLNEDHFDKAQALVKKLEGKRIEDPLVKALPWKLKLRESMMLSQRKASFRFAEECLDEAESLWPAWLGRNWLPFLKAGLALRFGNRPKFEELVAAAKQQQQCSTVVADIMTFAALQQMNIPSPELKPFRIGIERYLNSAADLDLADLFAVGSFFWDLARTGMKHKGYRVQASKLGRAFTAKTQFFESDELTPTQVDALSWGAQHRFWSPQNVDMPTPNVIKLASSEPRLASAVVRWIISNTYAPWRIGGYLSLVALLKEAARLEKDPFYRYQFDKTATEVEAVLADRKAKDEQFGSFDAYGDSEFEGEDFDDDDFEESECNCPTCRAKRARKSESRPKVEVLEDEFGENEDAEYVDEWTKAYSANISAQEGVPPIVAKVIANLGQQGVMEFEKIINSKQVDQNPGEFLRLIVKVFKKYGISSAETLQFMMAADRFNSKNLDSSPIPRPEEIRDGKSRPAMSVEESKAARKKRLKELERKRRKARQGK